jgi:hypothetical protein
VDLKVGRRGGGELSKLLFKVDRNVEELQKATGNERKPKTHKQKRKKRVLKSHIQISAVSKFCTK